MTIRALLTSDALAALQQNPGLRPAAAIEMVKHNNADYVRYLNSLDRDGYRALWHSIETASKSARV